MALTTGFCLRVRTSLLDRERLSRSGSPRPISAPARSTPKNGAQSKPASTSCSPPSQFPAWLKTTAGGRLKKLVKTLSRATPPDHRR